MKNSKKIICRNHIQKEYLNDSAVKKNNIIFEKILEKIYKNLDNSKDTLHSLSKKFNFNFKTKDLNKFKKFNTVVIIGMGGSILGSEAIYSFLKKKIRKNFLFFDNIDENISRKIKKEKNLNKILFIIISKSGNTVETLSNFLALKIIKKNNKNILIISEKKENSLFLLSKKNNYFFIEQKNYIGGRYSVLTEVGMVPAYLMGLNISNFRSNLLFHFKNKNKDFLKDSTIKLSYLLKKNQFKNIIFLNYVPKLDKLLYWCQQLMAESLGKKGKGFLPVISTAPKDHHSLLQLYLDGPKDKLFYIFSEENKSKQKINAKVFGSKIDFLNNKSLNQIKLSQKNAVLLSLKKNKIPFREFEIKEFDEKVLGELFSYFMLETAIVGMLSNINPFDQPAVEQVKMSTKKMLT